MQHKFSTAALLLVLLASSCARAGDAIHLGHAAAPDAHIRISNVKGSVTVTGWDRNEVHVGGQLGNGASPLVIDGSDKHLQIAVKNSAGPGFFHWGSSNAMGPTTLQVQVPRGASLDVDVVSAALNVDGLDGGSLHVNAVSGNVQIHAATRSLNVDSVSGSIEQSGHAGQARLQTVSGDILAPALGGDATLETVSGRMRIGGSSWHHLSVSSVSGDIQIRQGPAPGGAITVDSMSGDVQLTLASGAAASIQANSFSGDLRSDAGGSTERGHGSGSTLTTQIGKGGGRVKIETFSGDVRIRQQQP